MGKILLPTLRNGLDLCSEVLGSWEGVYRSKTISGMDLSVFIYYLVTFLSFLDTYIVYSCMISRIVCYLLVVQNRPRVPLLFENHDTNNKIGGFR